METTFPAKRASQCAVAHYPERMVSRHHSHHEAAFERAVKEDFDVKEVLEAHVLGDAEDAVLFL